MAAPALSFAPMAVHIGEEIERRRVAMRMSKSDLAREIGVDRTHIYDLISSPSVDTAKLRLCSRALHFNFFALLAHDLDVELGGSSAPHEVAEPQAVYARRPAERRAPLRLVIEVDPSDLEAQKIALAMAEKMQGTPPAPAPDRDKDTP